MTTSRPAIFALWAMMALSSGGCKWFGRMPKTPPPPPPPAPAPAPSAPQPPPPAPAVHPRKPSPFPAPAPAPPQPPPPPAFGQILTPQQQAEFRRTYQQSAQSARQALSQLAGRALSRDQADTVNRIRSFLSRADEAQSKDPSTAAQLARRAEILARDLLSSVR